MSRDYEVPPITQWPQSAIDHLMRDIQSGEPSEPDPAVDEGIRRAVDELGISHEARHAAGPGDQWDRNTELHAPTPSLRAGQDRDTRAGLLVAAIALLAVAAIVVVIGMQPYWATLTYWLNH